ncbi:MAG: hypothetical protein H6811_06910 [Phycisphaeraceae bacterium]|nr:hypothetical protein [Phycisphaeraceae bacterium]
MATRVAPQRETISPRVTRFALVGLGGLIALVLLASIGPGPLPHEFVLRVIPRSAPPVLLAGLYLVSAFGWGAIARLLWSASTEPLALRLATGLAIQLTLTHALGILGGLSPLTAWAQVLVGIGLLWIGRREWLGLLRAPPAIGLACLPAALVLLLAAANPPGWLWDSEFGAYDALSYHLQLPREWVEAGRIWPVEHNVYSFLPGYMEAAYTLLAHLWPWGQHEVPAFGDVATLGAQFLHASLALATAWLCARATSRWIRDAHMGERVAADRDALAATCGWIVGAIVLSTPWTVVAGSLAYNEMGVTALAAGALIASMDRRLGPARRGLLSGGLIGVACGVKPTALLLAGGPVGVLLCVSCFGRRESADGLWRPFRSLSIAVVAGTAAGLVMLAPWLIRNAIASGNPVFPQLASLFGTAHWDPDQVARYARAHRFDGALVDRAILLFAPLYEPGSRGITHPQWGGFFVACIGAGIVSIARRRIGGARTLTLALGLGLVCWLALTHVQSRFLLPLLVPGGVLIGIGLASIGVRHARSIGAVVVSIQVIVLLLTFIGQQGGKPNLALGLSPGDSGGAGMREAIEALPLEARRAQIDELSPFWYVNAMVPPGDTILLIGDATPFYVRSPVMYATTWDTQPFAEALRAHPDDPAGVVEDLRAQGIAWVLVDFAELDRLQREGWHDPLEAPRAVAEVLGAHAELVHHWESRQALLRLGGTSRE